MKGEKISIVTVSLNQGEFIERTINSVISQVGNFRLEYIIIDGGSTDNSLDIIRENERKLSCKSCSIDCEGIEFRYISELDESPTHALNKGLSIATGDIIGIINSDDTYNPGVFQKVAETFSDFSDDVIYGDILFIDENDNIVRLRKGKTDLSMKDFRHRNALVQPEVFFRRKLLASVGFFDETLLYANDYEFWLRMLKKKISFRYVPCAFANFRIRADARSSGRFLALHSNSLRIQYLYFGARYFIAPNLGSYSAQYARKTGIDIDKAYEAVKSEFLRESKIVPDLRMEKILNRGKCYAYLKFGIYQSSINRNCALKYGLKAFLHSPELIFTRKGGSLITRCLIGEKLYHPFRNFPSTNCILERWIKLLQKLW